MTSKIYLKKFRLSLKFVILFLSITQISYAFSLKTSESALINILTYNKNQNIIIKSVNPPILNENFDHITKCLYDPRKFEQFFLDKYGKNNVHSLTLPKKNMHNVKMAGKKVMFTLKNGDVCGLFFNLRGMPIFDKYVVYETVLPCQIISKGIRYLDSESATGNLRNDIINDDRLKFIFNTQQIESILKFESKIPDYTWHHHEDYGRMQLVPSEIHNHPKLSHVGGFSLTNGFSTTNKLAPPDNNPLQSKLTKKQKKKERKKYYSNFSKKNNFTETFFLTLGEIISKLSQLNILRWR